MLRAGAIPGKRRAWRVPEAPLVKPRSAGERLLGGAIVEISGSSPHLTLPTIYSV